MFGLSLCATPLESLVSGIKDGLSRLFDSSFNILLEVLNESPELFPTSSTNLTLSRRGLSPVTNEGYLLSCEVIDLKVNARKTTHDGFGILDSLDSFASEWEPQQFLFMLPLFD